MKNLLRVSATLFAVALGGVAHGDTISITEVPDVFQQSSLPGTSTIRLLYENTGSATDTLTSYQVLISYNSVLNADTNTDGFADNSVPPAGFVANAPVTTAAGTQNVLVGGFSTTGGATVAPGSVFQLFQFTLTIPAGTPVGVYPLNITVNEVVGTNVNVTTVIPGSIAVQGAAPVIPEPASLAMVGIAGVLGLGAAARRRLRRKAD